MSAPLRPPCFPDADSTPDYDSSHLSNVLICKLCKIAVVQLYPFSYILSLLLFLRVVYVRTHLNVKCLIMVSHGFDIQMRCMCAPFFKTRSQTCTSGFKVSVTVLRLGNRPYITIFSTKKHTYKVIFLRHLRTLLLFTHIAISIHEHNHITTQTP